MLLQPFHFIYNPDILLVSIPEFHKIYPTSTTPTNHHPPIHSLGVGAPLPQKAADGSWNRTELDSNDKLRKQLLGKNYDRVMKAAAEQKAAAAAATAAAASASAGVAKAEVEEEYDEEDGRSAMLARQKNKRKGGAGSGRGVHPAAAAAAAEAGDKGGEEGEGAPAPARSKGRKKATSYLDELLAERAKKRKKR